MKSIEFQGTNRKKRIYFWISIFTFLFGVNLTAEVKKENQVLDWDGDRRQFIHKKVTLEELGLKSQTHYVLENFAIHSKLDLEPIPLEQVEGNLKLLTLGFQLRKIESKFKTISLLSGSKEKITNFQPKVIVRVDAPYAYSPTDYFDTKVSLKNTALTIPPAESNGNWNSEMWFAPKWDFPVLSTFAFERIIDTATCPDSIYHEYTHLITGKYLGNNAIGRSLAEGVSDYYAASLLNHPELYTHKTCEAVKRQLLVSSFRLDKEIGFYDATIESDFKKDFAFIPSLLWQYRELVGSELADVTIFQAITKTNAGDRFFPEFIETLSSSLFTELKKRSGEERAKGMVLELENKVWVPHGVYSKVSQNQSVFSVFPKTSIRVPNSDEKSNEFCNTKNELEFYWKEVNEREPTLRFYWNCNQVKLPLVIQMEQTSPMNYLFSSNLHFLNGKLKFASISANKPNPKLSKENQVLYLQMYNYIKDNYFYRNTMEKEMRLYLDGGNDASHIQNIRMEFAYLGSSKKRFRYTFPAIKDGVY
ncbi:hypothetical protein EHQ68_08145 [Leptospira congkakensis]|uniref:Uncharacterized protein n=1 Tax=Leptospira congkakensis TaxID=2484932 RepID=A0A4Z1A3Y8_9LEPT|nr:hypothetical protein [Leptospira congkakensis]TGL88602.1 hypothetical protein EHQ69_14215 [Leptospira congkakensis]TGL89188.1 hypothetical protein EHQ68_08145 [Leptospira congkakensis]TGL97155.1 hypothetical protein EHQ70_07640 [Leptospira congkakensis]